MDKFSHLYDVQNYPYHKDLSQHPLITEGFATWDLHPSGFTHNTLKRKTEETDYVVVTFYNDKRLTDLFFATMGNPKRLIQSYDHAVKFVATARHGVVAVQFTHHGFVVYFWDVKGDETLYNGLKSYFNMKYRWSNVLQLIMDREYTERKYLMESTTGGFSR